MSIEYVWFNAMAWLICMANMIFKVKNDMAECQNWQMTGKRILAISLRVLKMTTVHDLLIELNDWFAAIMLFMSFDIIKLSSTCPNIDEWCPVILELASHFTICYNFSKVKLQIEIRQREVLHNMLFIHIRNNIE
jgi:hypothetical protein